MAEVDAKQAQRMAEAITRAADRAEAQINSQARKDKAASKQRQEEQETAKAEQQRQKRVSFCACLNLDVSSCQASRSQHEAVCLKCSEHL